MRSTIYACYVVSFVGVLSLPLTSSANEQFSAAPMYEPPSGNGAVLEGTGNTTAGVSIGTNGLTLQGAYAIADWLGVIGAASYWPRSRYDEHPCERCVRTPSAPRYGQSHLYAELGAGPLFVLSERLDWRLEMFLGLGLGQSTGQLHIPDTTHVMDITGSFLATFLQIDIGKIVTPAWEYAFIARLVDVNYDFHSVDGAPAHARRSVPFLQFAYSIRFGWKSIKGEAQLGLNGPLSTKSVLPYSVSSPAGYFLIGLFIRLGGDPPRWREELPQSPVPSSGTDL